MSARRAATVFFLLALGGCDLRHLEQRRFCASASADQDRCASRPDWCWASGTTTCVAKVPGADCGGCRPAAVREGSGCDGPTGYDASCAQRCQVHVTDFRCLAKNLCSGVVCP